MNSPENNLDQMISCAEFFAIIGTKDEDLTDDQREKAVEHLKNCLDCQDQEAELETRFALVDYETPGEGPEYFKKLVERVEITDEELKKMREGVMERMTKKAEKEGK